MLILPAISSEKRRCRSTTRSLLSHLSYIRAIRPVSSCIFSEDMPKHHNHDHFQQSQYQIATTNMPATLKRRSRWSRGAMWCVSIFDTGSCFGRRCGAPRFMDDTHGNARGSIRIQHMMRANQVESTAISTFLLLVRVEVHS